MKSFQLILLCFVCVAKSYGQGGQIVIEITKEKHKIFTTKVIQWINNSENPFLLYVLRKQWFEYRLRVAGNQPDQ